MSNSVSHVGVIRQDQTLEEAFPEVDAGVRPLGSRVLVQLKTAKEKSAGGILLPKETQDALQWNTQIAKVVAVGALAFKNRETMKSWPEGDWCKPGDFVRVSKYGGDRFEVATKQGVVLFVVFNDLDLIASVTCDPRDVLTFV